MKSEKLFVFREAFIYRKLVGAVAILVSGSVFSQLISLVILPALTRLYTPEDFAAFAVFTAVLGMLVPIAALRFEVALPLVAEVSEASKVLTIAFISVVVSTALVTVGVTYLVILGPGASELMGLKEIHDYLWLLPLGVLGGGVHVVLVNWSARQRDYTGIAVSRVIQTAAGAFAQVILGMGLLGLGSGGLLVGHIVNSGAGSAMLGVTLLRSKTSNVSTSIADVRATFSTYIRYPQYSVPESLLNNAGISVPLIIVAVFAEGPEAGYLSLAMRVMQAPLALVSLAVAQVYMSRVAEKHATGGLLTYSMGTLHSLCMVGVGPIVATAILAPALFALLFGQEWSRAGEMVAWMVPWLLLQLLATPMGIALHANSRQKLAMRLQAGGFIVRVVPVAVCGAWNPEYMVAALAISAAVFYAVVLWAVIHVLGIARERLLSEVIRPAALPSLGWIFAAAMTRVFVG